MHRSASVPRSRCRPDGTRFPLPWRTIVDPCLGGPFSHAQLAETASQPRPILKTIVEIAAQARTPGSATAEISIRAHTPGSAGALAGMIFRASTDLSITGKRSHNPPDHDAAFAPMGRRGRHRSQDEYPRPTGRNSRSATPNWEHHRGESRSASPNREDHRGHRRSGTHPWEHRRPRRHDLPCLNRPFNHRKAFTQPTRSPRHICPHGPARAPAFPGRVAKPNWPKQQVSLTRRRTPSRRHPVSHAPLGAPAPSPA